ncbi:nucleoside-diphosphate-sugar epimerase family protein [Aspergillus flavus]|nr:nucleoside-diphosphate-sugar epimerase family protein [Aspergillus flavus]
MTAVLITGATVKQGGSLITSLISCNAPFEILAVTRNPTSTSTQKLRSLSPSIKLVEGDLDNPARIFQNAQHLTSSLIWGVYSVQQVGNNAEETQGKSVIDEEHSYTNPTKIPHFIKKHNIEHHLVDRSKNTSMEWTILRPTAFYENLTPDFFGKVFATSFKMALAAKKLQMVATSNIGHFGADAFLNPNQYKGRGVSLAGDELSFEEMERIFVQKRGESLPMAFRHVCSLFYGRDEGYGVYVSVVL